jgi:hypothetical protein
MKKKINYSFHIGERCQFLALLKNNNLISGLNPFSGTYISINNSFKLIKSKFEDFENNLLQFKISTKEYNIINKTKNIDKLDEMIKNNKFYFFDKENFYKDKDYCINLNYTSESNFLIDDMYYWNDYFVLPNVNYNLDTQKDTYYRRKNRFMNCLETNNPDEILLIYMNKLIPSSIDVYNFIEHIKSTYDLSYNLFLIIPTSDKITEEIVIYNNIYFYIINFPSLEIQLNNNPGDDLSLHIYCHQYNTIKSKLFEYFDINLMNLYD